ncbi:hypothetical protein FPHYL_2780 [Fusarium phyllophilum]|uniref:CBM-cenC domain-containing protein n=1 Tax=Fusarium phyllophilum TaxID=47803 RepID=A0A8H5KB10_9HYPO|nr:hypothetical protein FPHYL_2780 [Fusarium phyllophilum]
MKATRFSLTFVALALCGSVYAGPCKPKSSTALIGTTSTEATLSASTEISTATSVAESSTTDLSSIISESITSSATATLDSQFSSSTELLSLSVTTETATATTSAAELSSTIETLTTSNTAEVTTSDAATTSTAEVSVPSNLFLNPSFDEPNADGDFDGSPWTLSDSVSPLSVSISSDLAHSGSHSAYWSIDSTAQNGVVSQTVALEQFQTYALSYWWYVDEDAQPQNIDCYIVVDQTSTDGLTSTFANLKTLTPPLPLKTWTKWEATFNSINIAPAKMGVNVLCDIDAGTGIKVAIDDVYLAKQA